MRTIIVFFIACGSLLAQGRLAPSANTVGASGLAGSKPGTCSLGQQYTATDGTATAALYLCTATNTWTLQKGNTPGIYDVSNYSSLQTALTAAGVSGGTVILGTVAVTSTPITIPSGVTLQCLNGGGVKMANGAWMNFATAGLIGNTADGLHDITVDSCNVDGNQANNTVSGNGSCSLITFGGYAGTCGAGGFTSGSRIRVQNSYIHDFPGGGGGANAAVYYAMSSGATNSFINNIVSSPGAKGGAFVTLGPDTLVSGNTMTGPWGDAALTCNSATCTGARFVLNKLSGSSVNIESGAATFFISSNTLDSCGTFCIGLTGVGENGYILNNTITGVTTNNNGIILFTPFPSVITIIGPPIQRASGPPPSPFSIGGVPVPQPPGYLINIASTHINTYGGAPTPSTCGTSPTFPSSNNDTTGSFIIGAGGTGCTITFSVPYAVAPNCFVYDGTGTGKTATITASSITMLGSVGPLYYYICIGSPE